MKNINNINNKGFTLIELLGVIVVLLAITLVAIPSIASTFERNKNKINEQKKEVIKSAAEIYASRYLKFDTDPDNYPKFLTGNCGISIQTLLDYNLITRDELKDSNGAEIYNHYSASNYDNVYVYVESAGVYKIKNGGSSC